VKGFPPPNSLFVGLPAGIRSVLLERTAQAIESGTNPFKDSNLAKLSPLARFDYITASIEMGRTWASPYRKASLGITGKLQSKLSNAQKLEKAGEIQKAVDVYENCIENGFLGSLPYERLRIIYTKQGQFQNAIRVCKRYIEILEMVKEFWHQYPNIRQIPKYKEMIKKLSTKI
jgi:tetratricopeptide (TPR) repeat protein